ncbi:MAG: polysaccharide biosynthesis C-terminal domain-containing protein [Saprospiraceae bacterium]|nr:polysaccharide biosynthesis C-terminal domain-containing protein [Saprospiraceae bacterium]
MGIIKRQSIYFTIISYLGLVIGAVNTLLLMPHFLTQEEVGLIGVFSALAFPLAAISNMGAIFAINRFLPYYKKLLPPGKIDLPLITVLISLLGFIFIFLIVHRNDFYVFQWFSKAPLLVEYFYLIPFFTLGYMLCSIFQALNNGYFYTVWVGIVTEVIFRIFNLTIILLLAFKMYEFYEYLHIYVFMFWLGLILYIWKLKKETNWTFFTEVSILTKRIKKYMFPYSGFFWFTSVFSVLATMIDTIVLAGMQGLEKSGSLMIATYFITVTMIPQKSIVSVSVPVISESWRKKDMDNLLKIYWKSANNMLWAGGFIFLVILLNINQMLAFLPKSYHEIKWVIFILGMAKMIDYSTGVNQNILSLSRKNWKMDFYSNIILVILLIPLNYYLISAFGIIGSALANFVGYLVYNVIRTTYLWVALKISPFNRQNVLLIGIILFFIGLFTINMYFFPVSEMDLIYNILFIFFKSIVFVVVFILAVVILGASADVKDLFTSNFVYIKNKFR